MRLQIKNFAAIRAADIQFDGITVIAGENDAGKSTVGKLLFSLFHSLYDMSGKIQMNRWQAVANKVVQDIDESMILPLPPMSGDLLDPARLNRSDRLLQQLQRAQPKKERDCLTFVKENIKIFIGEQAAPSDELLEQIERDVHAIYQYTDAQIRNTILSSVFNDVFAKQANSKRNKEPADLRLTLKGKSIHIVLQDEACQDISGETAILHSATYIDDPFVVDHLVGLHLFTWKNLMSEDLKEKMRLPKKMDLLSKQMRKDQTEQIIQTLRRVMDGELRETNDGPVYHQSGLLEDLSLRNLSTGLKAFAIIKRLLEYHNLNEQDVLILDEPEIHLHPEWQLIYAELIVLLQKAFHLTVLLTTHSPYFLEAIEVFSAKHGLEKEIKYYLAHKQDGYAVFDDVTDDTARIYHRLAEPFDKLDAIKQGKGWC